MPPLTKTANTSPKAAASRGQDRFFDDGLTLLLHRLGCVGFD